jgi:hypothetical protein
MPHYFFNLLFGDRLSQDEEGVELRDCAAAREEAFAIIRELSDPALGGNPRRWAGWALQVADEAGPFMRAPIGHPALEIVTGDWQPASKRPPAPRPRPVRQPQRWPTARKLSAIVRQTLERRTRMAVLVERNRQLREEISRMARKSKEIRARTQFLVACAQGVEWAIDGGHRSAAKRLRLAGGAGAARALT